MTNSIDEFKCRKCGGDIIYNDEYDESFDGSKVYAYWYGCCKDCGQAYNWCEVYTLESIEDFREADD